MWIDHVLDFPCVIWDKQLSGRRPSSWSILASDHTRDVHNKIYSPNQFIMNQKLHYIAIREIKNPSHHLAQPTHVDVDHGLLPWHPLVTFQRPLSKTGRSPDTGKHPQRPHVEAVQTVVETQTGVPSPPHVVALDEESVEKGKCRRGRLLWVFCTFSIPILSQLSEATISQLWMWM